MTPVRKVAFAVVLGLIVAGGAFLWLGLQGGDPSSPLMEVATEIGWSCIAAGVGSLLLWLCLRRLR